MTAALRRALLPAGIGAVLALGACRGPNPRVEMAAQAPALLTGMPKQTLLSCAGVPDRQAAIDNLEYYTYTSRRTVMSSSPSASVFGSRYHRPGFGWGYSAPLAPDTELYNVDCEATFTLRNGVVERLVYGGDASRGASRLNQCYAVVENCLAMLPPSPTPLP